MKAVTIFLICLFLLSHSFEGKHILLSLQDGSTNVFGLNSSGSDIMEDDYEAEFSDYMICTTNSADPRCKVIVNDEFST